MSEVNVEALPIQYKEGKQIDFFKQTSLEQIDKIEKLATSVKKKPTSWNAAQLLLELEALQGSNLDHLAAALMLVPGSDGKLIRQAFEWGETLSNTSTNIIQMEKRIEQPVMMMLMARDALLDVCKDKLVQ